MSKPLHPMTCHRCKDQFKAPVGAYLSPFCYRCQDEIAEEKGGYPASKTSPKFAGETNVETVAGSPYRSAYSFRVF